VKRISAVAQVRRPTTRWTEARVVINLIVGIDVVHNRRVRVDGDVRAVTENK